jgi:hypothetical protein
MIDWDVVVTFGTVIGCIFVIVIGGVISIPLLVAFGKWWFKVLGLESEEKTE